MFLISFFTNIVKQGIWFIGGWWIMISTAVESFLFETLFLVRLPSQIAAFKCQDLCVSLIMILTVVE